MLLTHTTITMDFDITQCIHTRVSTAPWLTNIKMGVCTHYFWFALSVGVLVCVFVCLFRFAFTNAIQRHVHNRYGFIQFHHTNADRHREWNIVHKRRAAKPLSLTLSMCINTCNGTHMYTFVSVRFVVWLCECHRWHIQCVLLFFASSVQRACALTPPHAE